jgi:hypothetical protein
MAQVLQGLMNFFRQQFKNLPLIAFGGADPADPWGDILHPILRPPRHRDHRFFHRGFCYQFGGPNLQLEFAQAGQRGFFSGPCFGIGTGAGGSEVCRPPASDLVHSEMIASRLGAPMGDAFLDPDGHGRLTYVEFVCELSKVHNSPNPNQI